MRKVVLCTGRESCDHRGSQENIYFVPGNNFSEEKGFLLIGRVLLSQNGQFVLDIIRLIN